MYYVVDTAKLPAFIHKETAVKELAEGSTQQVLMPVGNVNNETMELLYGLCTQLMDISGINPNDLIVEMHRSYGIQKITATEIILNGRTWLDSPTGTKQ